MRRLPSPLLTGAVTLSAGEILGKVATLVTFSVIARHYGVSAFGVFNFALGLGLLLASGVSLGLDQRLIQLVGGDLRTLGRHLTTALALRIGLFLLITGTTAAVATICTGSASKRFVIGCLVVSACLDAVTETFRTAANILGRQTTPAAILVLQRLVCLGTVVAATRFSDSLPTVAAAYTFASFLGLTLMGAFVLDLLAPGLHLGRVRRADLAQYASVVHITGLNDLVSMALFRVDVVILGLLTTDAVVGQYTAGYRLLETVLFVCWSICRVTQPALADLSRSHEERGRVLAAAFVAIGVVYAPYAAIMVMHGSALADLLFGSGLADTSVTRALALSPLLFGVAQVAVVGVLAIRPDRAVVRASAAALVVNVGGNLLFVPAFGAIAAALLTTASYGVQALLAVIAVRRFFSWAIPRDSVLAVLGATALMSAVMALAGPPVVVIVVGGVAYLVAVAVLARCGLFAGVRSAPRTSPALRFPSRRPPRMPAFLAWLLTQDRRGLVAFPVTLERLVCCSMAAVLILGPWYQEGVVPGMAVVTALGLALGCCHRERISWRYLAVAALVPLTQSASLAVAADPSWSIRLVEASWLGLGCVHAVLHLRPSSRRLVAQALVAGAWCVSVAAIASSGPMSTHEGGGVVTGRAQGPFSQPNELGAMIIMALPFAFAAVAQSKRRFSSGLSAGLLGVVVITPLVLALGLSLSRGAWLGLVVLTVTCLWLMPSVRPLLKTMVIGLSCVMLLGFVSGNAAVGAFVSRLGSLGETDRSVSDHRPDIWAFAVHLAETHPLLGVGAGGVPEQSAYPSFSPLAFVQPLHAHDLVLNTLAEGGLLAGAALVTLAAAGASQMARARRGQAPSTTLAAGAALAAMTAHGLLDVPWRAPALTGLAWIIAGLFSPLLTSSHDPIDQRTPTMPATPHEASTSRRALRIVNTSWNPAALILVVGTLVSLLVAVLIPQHDEVSAVIGLRSVTSGTQTTPIPVEELQQIAQQEAVAIASRENVEEVRREAGLGAGSKATTKVDPESATIRITGQGDDRDEAVQLTRRLASRASGRLQNGHRLEAPLLEQPTAQFASRTPNRLLIWVGGEAVSAVAALGYVLVRRRYR